jgi:hypothetical protein
MTTNSKEPIFDPRSQRRRSRRSFERLGPTGRSSGPSSSTARRIGDEARVRRLRAARALRCLWLAGQQRAVRRRFHLLLRLSEAHSQGRRRGTNHNKETPLGRRHHHRGAGDQAAPHPQDHAGDLREVRVLVAARRASRWRPTTTPRDTWWRRRSARRTSSSQCAETSARRCPSARSAGRRPARRSW